jgi:maltooligosyltrehalose trehalohydrolase
MDAQWSDDFHHALFTVIGEESIGGYYSDFGKLGDLAKALEQTFVYDGIYSKYRNRIHGRSAAQVPQHRFLGYIQNHDQVGNRAVGDRVHQTVGFNRAKLAAAVVLLSPFIPMIFEGEEWAASTPFQYFADHDDPEMARLVAEGRRREFAAFGWPADSIPNPEKRETFEHSKLDWSEVAHGEHAEMLAWYRDLIHLRRVTPSLNNADPGHVHVRYDEQQQWFSMRRGEIMLACNLADQDRKIEVPGDATVLMSSLSNYSLKNGTLEIPPDGAVVLQIEKSQPVH